MKLFLYFNDVDESNGAAEYVLHSAWGRKHQKMKPQRYPLGATIPDPELRSRVAPEEIVTCAFSGGTAYLVDTTGFHRGGWVSKGERQMYTATYVSDATPYLPMTVVKAKEAKEESAWSFCTV